MIYQNQDSRTQDKAKRIIRWRETLSTMPDERFFEIMRVYIGEIHTPYNKDNLIEQLSSIFRKETIRKTIISYLSEFDLKILTAISLIKDCNQQKLIDFFKHECLLSEIYTELINLNDRLLIYSFKDPETKEHFIALNPLLEETLEDVLNIKFLLPEPVFAERNFNAPVSVTPGLIAAFYSYILENPGLCKNNAELKKRDEERLKLLFSEKFDCVKLLLNSFINLGLVKIGEKEVLIDKKRFEAFAALPEMRQYVFLAGASVVHLSRSALQSHAQLLLNTIKSIPESGLSLSSLFRITFLIKYHKESETPLASQSRFSKMLESHRSQNTDFVSGEIIEEILKNSITIGLLQETGKNEKNEPVVIPGEVFKSVQNYSSEKKGILNINAGTSITILPGLKLSELLPLSNFMNIVSCNTVSEYEITKKSAYRAFDSGLSLEKLLELLSLYNAYKIPQSLEMNLEDWNKTYSSSILYKGYVLKVDEKTKRLIDNNPNIKAFISEELAPGIYLLNIPLDQEPADFIEKSGLENLSSVKSVKNELESAGFPILSEGKNCISAQKEISINFEENDSKSQELKKEFLEYLNSLNLSKQQTECLAARIRRNIILSKEQIKPETVRLEILEADGMNFSGKVHLIENAISRNDMLEIKIPDEENHGTLQTYFGKPLFIARQTNDSILKMQLNDTEETKIFSVSRINHAKIVKTSVF